MATNKATDVLTDHYLQCTGIVAVSAEADGSIGVIDVVTVDCGHDRVTFCCGPGKQHEIANLARSLLSANADQEHVVAAIRTAAAERMIGLTPHSKVVARAQAAVAKVEETMADMLKSGVLKAINHEFKAAREAGLASSYSAFIHAKKIALLEIIALGRR